jgi:hypothetical protein
VARKNNFRAEFSGARRRGIEIFHFKPQQNAIAMSEGGISSAAAASKSSTSNHNKTPLP